LDRHTAESADRSIHMPGDGTDDQLLPGVMPLFPSPRKREENLHFDPYRIK
jgi:hypothetical protein